MPRRRSGDVLIAAGLPRRNQSAEMCPSADSCGAAKESSFDHLVGEQLYRVRHLDAEYPGRLQVDDELELGRLQDRQIGGFRTLEDLAGVDAHLTKHVQTVGPIAH